MITAPRATCCGLTVVDCIDRPTTGTQVTSDRLRQHWIIFGKQDTSSVLHDNVHPSECSRILGHFATPSRVARTIVRTSCIPACPHRQRCARSSESLRNNVPFAARSIAEVRDQRYRRDCVRSDESRAHALGSRTSTRSQRSISVNTLEASIVDEVEVEQAFDTASPSHVEVGDRRHGDGPLSRSFRRAAGCPTTGRPAIALPVTEGDRGQSARGSSTIAQASTITRPDSPARRGPAPSASRSRG